MVKLIVVIAFGCVFILSGCLIDSSKSYSVLNAEKALIDKDFEQALKYYQEVDFEDYISSRHLYNALIVALMLKKTNLAETYSKKLLKNGAPKTVIIELYNQNNIEIPNLMEVAQRKASAEAEQITNLIEQMHFDDQKHRISGHQDSIQIVDDMNFNLLKKLIYKTGYPNENIVGNWYSKSGITHNPLNIVILHLLQKTYPGLYSLLEQEYLKGNINEFTFAQWIPYGNNYTIQQHSVFCGPLAFTKHEKELYTFKCDSAAVDRIRTSRNHYQMDSLGIALKKLHLRYEHGLILYTPDPYIQIIGSFADSTSRKMYLSQLEKINLN